MERRGQGWGGQEVVCMREREEKRSLLCRREREKEREREKNERKKLRGRA